MANEILQTGIDASDESEVLKFEDMVKSALVPSNNALTKRRRDEMGQAVRALAAVAMENAHTLSGNTSQKISTIIEGIDKMLTTQINSILHNKKFQEMESAWRGLDFLLQRSELSKSLRVKVMSISKDELYEHLADYPGSDWDQSPLFRKIYSEHFGTLGGEPYGAIIGDYEFDHSAPDIGTLKGMARIAAAAHAPFISAASPALMNAEHWSDIGNRRDLAEIFQSPEYVDWRDLRESEDSRYLGLALPRFLARRPYGDDNPVRGFNFVEETGGSDINHDNFCWANAAYAMAANINEAQAYYGWASCIRGADSGGSVYDLPTHKYSTESGETAVMCPTETSIDDRREQELANCGLMPLIHRKNTSTAVFISAQSVQEPFKYDDDDASKNAQLSARLPYIFASSRFAHYLKCMVRDKVGSFMEKDDMKKMLQEWINNYKLSGAGGNEAKKAERPLKDAEVTVMDDPANPGYYRAVFNIRPHYQLEGVDVSLRLTSTLPSQK